MAGGIIFCYGRFLGFPFGSPGMLPPAYPNHPNTAQMEIDSPPADARESAGEGYRLLPLMGRWATFARWENEWISLVTSSNDV